MSSVLKNDDLKIGITIQVNGHETMLAIKGDMPLTVNDYLMEADISGRFVVVVNDQIVPKAAYQTALLNEGDQLDVMSPISGG